MAIDPYATSGTTTGTASATSTSLSTLSSDYQSFITLLTAQIENQDPLEPMDSTAFVSQLATLTQVEQSVLQNANLEGISAQLASLSSVAGLSMIGHDVVAPTSEVLLSDGAATLGYRLGNEASAVTMDVVASDGTLVRSFYDLSGTPGQLQEVPWDGMDATGAPLPDGPYSMRLTALDADGNAVTAETYALSRVTGLVFENGLAMLQLDSGEEIMAGLIEEVR